MCEGEATQMCESCRTWCGLFLGQGELMEGLVQMPEGAELYIQLDKRQNQSGTQM